MNKKKNVFIGIFFVVISSVCTFFAFYFMNTKSTVAYSRPINFQNTQSESSKDSKKFLSAIKNNIDEKNEIKLNSDKEISQEVTYVKKKEKAINLTALVHASKDVYGEEEKNRREGFLWVDRKSSRCIITLGAYHGLMPGRQLEIYAENKQVGKVEVEVSFDVISYVHPVNKGVSFFDADYYRVVMN